MVSHLNLFSGGFDLLILALDFVKSEVGKCRRSAGNWFS